MRELEIRECLSEKDFVEAYTVVRILRENLSLDEYLIRISEAQKTGYRLCRSYLDDEIVGTIGFRILTDFCWGENLYVDDLVVVEENRRSKVGTLLMDFVENLAVEQNCQYVRLASGINRYEAHQFYEQLGYRKSSFAFARKLA